MSEFSKEAVAAIKKRAREEISADNTDLFEFVSATLNDLVEEHGRNFSIGTGARYMQVALEERAKVLRHMKNVRVPA